MKTYNKSVLKGALIVGAIALCFSLNLSAGVINHSSPSFTAVSDTGKMKKKDMKMKKQKMKKSKMEPSKMEPSKMEEDKMGSKM